MSMTINDTFVKYCLFSREEVSVNKYCLGEVTFLSDVSKMA
jgi:hypothetical protein